jgi:hypothetical protein
MDSGNNTFGRISVKVGVVMTFESSFTSSMTMDVAPIGMFDR